jgi:hypothetical protein
MVELVKVGRPPEELEKEFEPTAQTIIKWVAQADRDVGARHDGRLRPSDRNYLDCVARSVSSRLSVTYSLTRGRPVCPETGPYHRGVRIHDGEPSPMDRCYDGAAAGGLRQWLRRVAGA